MHQWKKGRYGVRQHKNEKKTEKQPSIRWLNNLMLPLIIFFNKTVDSL